MLIPVNQDLSEARESCIMFWNMILLNSTFNVEKMRLNSTSEMVTMQQIKSFWLNTIVLLPKSGQFF